MNPAGFNQPIRACRSVRTGAIAQKRDLPLAHLPQSDQRSHQCQACGYFHTEPTYRAVV